MSPAIQLDFAPMHDEPILPPAFEPIRILRESEHGQVLHARRGADEVILRLGRRDHDPQSLAELALLGSVDHPGLARLVGHGSLEGWDWVAREWVQGRTLTEVAGESSPARIGRILASLTPALDHLHRRGFLHGDLKPENILIRDDGEPVLTDFGLSGRAPEGRAQSLAGGTVAGSHFAIAPEVLLGHNADARSDLFALGVMLHQLLVGKRATAREFYARFPHVSFFEATETTSADLPEWARAQTSQLLELDPLKRPSSALAVGRALSAALGFELPAARETLPQLSWPRTLGRESWIADWIESVRKEFQRFQRSSGRNRRPIRPQRLLLPSGEDRNGFMSHLGLLAAVERIPVRTIDLSAELSDVTNTAELDRWVRNTISTAQDTCLFVQSAPDDRWSERALETLARTSLQAQADPRQDTACLLISAPHGVQLDQEHDALWSDREVQNPTLRDVRTYLETELNFEDAAELEPFAKKLTKESGGASELLQAQLDAYVSQGWIVTGTPLPRARTGITSARIAVTDDAAQAPKLSKSARALASALFVQRQAPTFAEVKAFTDLADGELAQALEELRAHELVTIQSVQGTLQATAKALGTPPDCTPEEWRALHRRVLDTETPTASQATVLRYLAGEDAFVELLGEVRYHRERGCPELTIDLVTLLQERAPLIGRELEPELVGELAAAWIARGEVERAELTLAASRQSVLTRQRAVTAYVDGLLARQQHELDRALKEFEKARELGYHDNGELLLSRARLLFERRDEPELETLLTNLQQSGPEALLPRVETDLCNIRAMHLFRTGKPALALEELETQLIAAKECNNTFPEAAVHINLGTILRHTGEWEKSTEHFQAAERLYDQAGFLPGLAQARALLGACLRESGRLADAEPLLTSSLEIRERLGDRQGHSAVLGMLGLLHADQGIPRAAMDELARGAEALLKGERTQDALVLSTRLDEVRARVAPSARRTLNVVVSEKDDPRCWISRCRTAWLRGDSASAIEYAAHARDRARASNSKRAEEEALFLLDRLSPADEAQTPKRSQSYTSPVVSLDDEVVRMLEDPSFDPHRARFLAGTLASRGRKDRAARLHWAIRARSHDERLVRDSGREGDKLFTEIARGLTDSERAALARSLLGFPDPCPADLEEREAAVARSGYEEREIELLLEVSRSLVHQTDLTKLLGSIVECALALTGGKRGFIVLEEEGQLHFDTAIDSRRGDIAAPEVETSASVIHQSLEAMRPLRLSNAVDDPLLGTSPSVVDLELRSILSCPFVVRDGVRGVIYVDHKLQSGAFDERSERLISHLAYQAAIAIRQVRYLNEIEGLNEQLKDRVINTESDLRTARAALREAGVPVPTTGLVGSSSSIRRVHELIGRAAPTALPVLVIGPSGTGKELAARALHELGSRPEGPFISENCASLPESLIESEFFGYQKGAFTGADSDREGMFERADGGTIFLDEIGELTLELQAKLLRVLETGEVRRLGDSQLRRVDFRLLAATNRDLEACVSQKTFRADLYYRLDALRIDMPPLSDRVGDIPELVQHFLRQEEARTGATRAISKSVVAALCRRSWPGNVRELANEVSRLCVLSDGDLVDPDAIRAPAQFHAESDSNEVKTLAETERDAIQRAISKCNGDKDKAAALLGISRAKIYQRLKLWRETAVD